MSWGFKDYQWRKSRAFQAECIMRARAQSTKEHYVPGNSKKPAGCCEEFSGLGDQERSKDYFFLLGPLPLQPIAQCWAHTAEVQ